MRSSPTLYMTNTRLKLDGYEVWVVVEGEEVEHYSQQVDGEGKVATCWIASTVGKRFAVTILKEDDAPKCGIKLIMDGSQISSYHFVGPTTCISGVTDSSTIRPFIFGLVELTDDDSYVTNASVEHLGEIKLTMHRVTNVITTLGRPNWRFKPPEVGRLHEQVKKSLTHHIMFGEGEKTTVTARTKGVKIDFHEVVATFVFRYRSLNMLQAMGIAPREAAPVPTSQGCNLTAKSLGKRKAPEVKVEEDDSEEEIPDVSDKIHELERELTQLKESLLRPKKKKVKQELRPNFIPGEVIDLTL